jgi:hypothetical protein
MSKHISTDIKLFAHAIPSGIGNKDEDENKRGAETIPKQKESDE